jgi:hypothetical protein
VEATSSASKVTRMSSSEIKYRNAPRKVVVAIRRILPMFYSLRVYDFKAVGNEASRF